MIVWKKSSRYKREVEGKLVSLKVMFLHFQFFFLLSNRKQKVFHPAPNYKLPCAYITFNNLAPEMLPFLFNKHVWTNGNNWQSTKPKAPASLPVTDTNSKCCKCTSCSKKNKKKNWRAECKRSNYSMIEMSNFTLKIKVCTFFPPNCLFWNML